MAVYFVQAGSSGPIKIGYTKNAVRARVRELQCGHYLELRILAIQPGGIAVERGYHDRFAANHIRGEWFSPTPDLLDYALRLGSIEGRNVAGAR